ncbi:MAG: site-specific integrase [Planctomycetaceae bacterium]|nr:site-specific integrase [Planctomycetaceae bacterium]
MASLYKKAVTVTDPTTGNRVKGKSRKWWGRYKDENGIERRVSLAVDETAALAMLNDIVKKAERRMAGIIDRFDDQRTRPLTEHLTDFEAHLQSNGVTDHQVKTVLYRARRIIDGCKARLIGDLLASRVTSFLADLRKGGISIQTSNHYLRAIKQFTRWMVKDHRTGDDQLAFIAMMNVRTDRRHDRRPLTDAELKALLAAAQKGKPIMKLTGPDRAMLYATAAYTGLRASELASLIPASFNLKSTPYTVTVQAAYSKHRREDVLPVHPSLAEMLRPWLAAKPANKPIWPGSWARAKCGGKILQRDLKAAGIPYVDENGLYADFHALRHTFITNMVKSGVSPKTAQSLARHCTIDLTMNVYTSLTVIDQAEALAVLPSVPRPEAPASGGTQEPECNAAGRRKMAAMVSRGAGNRVQRLASEEYRLAPDDTERQENGNAGTPDSLRHANAVAASCGTPPCHCGTTIDPDLQQVIVSWNRLPQSTRDAISILVRG